MQETGIGYCPFSFCAGSRYDKLYRDIGAQGRVAGGHDTTSSLATGPCNMARRPCDTALRYGQEALRYDRPARWGEQQRACAGPGRWGVSRYNRLYYDRREVWCGNIARQGLRYGAQRPATRCRSTATRCLQRPATR